MSFLGVKLHPKKLIIMMRDTCLNHPVEWEDQWSISSTTRTSKIYISFTDNDNDDNK